MAGGRPRATALCGAGHGGFQERRGVEGSVVREMPVWLCLSVCSPGRACGRSGRGRRRVVAAGGGRARGAWASDRRAEWLASAAAQRTAAPLVRPWTAAGGGGRRRTRARGVGVRPACRVVGVGGRPAHCGTVGQAVDGGGWWRQAADAREGRERQTGVQSGWRRRPPSALRHRWELGVGRVGGLCVAPSALQVVAQHNSKCAKPERTSRHISSRQSQ
jgi:hypothetical protein